MYICINISQINVSSDKQMAIENDCNLIIKLRYFNVYVKGSNDDSENIYFITYTLRIQ